jgi:Uma2 family endonuclease
LARATDTKPWTADELRRLPDGWRYEIDEGELVIMAPAGFDHGERTGRVTHVLADFVYRHRLGAVLAGELGVHLRREPLETLRSVDVAFYSHERMARIADRKGFATVPPDLAVKIHDPTEPDLGRKVRQYLEAGVRAVWVLDPETRSLTRHAPGEAPRTWSDPEAVVEEPVLPGFSCRLRELFGQA